MELSFSSERDDYDDADPTAAPRTATTNKHSLIDDDDASRPSLKPNSKPPIASAAANNKNAPAASNSSSSSLFFPTSSSAAKPKPTVTELSHLPVQKPLQNNGWGSSSSATSSSSSAPPAKATEKKPTAKDTKPSKDSGAVEEIQAFNPNDEPSISRKRSSSRSQSGSKRTRAERKRQNAEAAAARRAKLEAAAPGAIGDDSDRSHLPSGGGGGRGGGKAGGASLLVDDSGVVMGSAAGKSMLAGMGRKGGKGAFAPDKQLDFSSDEEEEGEAAGKKRQKKEEKKPAAGSSSNAAASSSSSSAPPNRDDSRAREPTDVAPLINDVAADFVSRRLLSTFFGGALFTWSAASSDERLPGLPAKFVLAQVGLMLYPVLVGLVLNGLNHGGTISQSGIAALIAGVVVALLHVCVHCTHRSVLNGDAEKTNASASSSISQQQQKQQRSNPSPTSTKVADSSSIAGGVESTSKPLSPSAAAAAKAKPASLNHDNFEQELQALVKLHALQNGSLPSKKKSRADEEKAKKKEADKAKRKQEEEEEDASLPPGVARRAAKRDDDDSDDEGNSAEAAKDAASSPRVDLSLLRAESLRFLLGPAPRSLARIFGQALASGLVMSAITYMLSWDYMHLHFDGVSAYATDPQAVGVQALVFMAAAWGSFALNFYSLNIRPAVEPVKYSAGGGGVVDEYLNAPGMRSFYMLLIALFHLSVRLLAESANGTTLFPLHQVTLDTHRVVLVFFPVLPFLFLLGVLPPLDALFLYAFEQIYIVCFGGSGSVSSDARLFFLLGVQTVAALLVFLVWLGGNQSGAMIFALGASFFLAWNILPIQLGRKVGAAAGEGALAVADPALPFPSFLKAHLSSSFLPLRGSSLLKVGVSLGICAAGVGVSVAGGTDSLNMIHELHALHDADIAFDAVALVGMLVLLVLSEVFQPYVLFHRLRNPFYSRLTKKLFVPARKPGLTSNNAAPAAASETDAEEEALDQWTPFLRAARKHRALQWTLRLYLVLYIAFHQDFYGQDSTVLDKGTHNGRLTLFVYAALCLRSFNLAWAGGGVGLLRSYIHIVFLIALNIVLGFINNGSPWFTLNWTVRLLICGFVCDRFRYELLPKIWYFASLSYTSFSYPKLRMRNHAAMKALWVLLLPYHTALLLRLWQKLGGKFGMNEAGGSNALGNEITNGGKDTVFYQQMFPGLYAALQAQLLQGPLAYSFAAGDFFLLRAEPYLIWVSVLEVGLGYTIFQMKGLELQTTSCHTVEALRMDENIDAILDSSLAKLPTFNPLPPTYAYHPQLTLTGVNSFNITKNVLTGIIDDRENLELLSRTFLKCLVWKLHQPLLLQGGKGNGGAASSSSLSSSLLDAFPASWLKPTVSTYDLNQLDDQNLYPSLYVNSLFGRSALGGLSEKDAPVFKKIVMSIYAIVETLASDMVATGGKKSAQHVFHVFQGVIGTSLYSDYLLAKGDAEKQQLKQLVIDSYRLATKALYDCAAMASLETLAPDDGGLSPTHAFTPSSDDAHSDFHELLEEYEREWFIGLVADPQWELHVAGGHKKMFSIGRAPNEANKFTSLTLDKSPLSLRLCSLSPVAIKAIWASLNLELFYFANDDDERYSIQAHPQLLRNLTVQSSEPPLGYPVYSDLPTMLSTE